MSLLNDLCSQKIDIAGRRSQMPIAPLDHLHSISQPAGNYVDGLPLGDEVAGKATSGIVDSASDTTPLHVGSPDPGEIVPVHPFPRRFVGVQDIGPSDLSL